MTTIIYKSQLKHLGFDFDQAVKERIQALLDHRLTTNTPAPAASHPLVELVVQRVPGVGNHGIDNYAADYQIVNDDQPVTE